jgi:intraflagellar transport protein 20
MQQQLESREKQLTDLKESYAALQDATNRQNDSQADKFGRERRDLNDRIEQLGSEVSKRERAILSLENQKEGLASQVKAKDKVVEELKAEAQNEKGGLAGKIEELKLKHDQAMDELTQTKINFEREKALKDQRLTFQEQRIKEYHDQMAQSIERYEERLKQEKEEAQKTLAERIARIQQEKENVDVKYEQKRKALKELEKNVQ